MDGNTWIEYEREKRTLRGLQPEEYENAVKELARRLGL